jgi:hypothetical protein
MGEESIPKLVCRAFLYGFSPWTSTSKPITFILNQNDNERAKLMAVWKKERLGELEFVGLAVSTVP